MVFPRCFLLLPTALVVLSASPGRADWKSEIGWPEFVAEAGPGYPDGTGVQVVHVEVDESSLTLGSQVLPSSSDSQMSGKSISDETGGGLESAHALTVARLFYGNSSSVAPGVSDIHAYEATDYVNSLSGISSSRRVHCNPWVGGASASTLGSIDGTINSKGFLLVAGLNNHGGSSVPDLFGTTYNGLSVGLSDGTHSSGGTVLAGYGPGRVKPEVVIPHGTVPGNSWTSFATGEVSSVAAVLYEAADDGGHGDVEDNSEVMKAILMAGAVKHKFPGWDRTTTRPLDEVYGAGEVNIFNSYRILDAGEQSTGGSVATTGWAYNYVRNSTTERSYSFSLAETAAEFSAVLNWNHSGSGTVKNLGLRLERTDGGTVLYDESQSTVDNVEHIYFRNLPPGDYTLKAVLAASSSSRVWFGLAWRTEMEGEAETVIDMLAGQPEITVRNVFKGKEHKIRSSDDLINWTDVHTFTPTSWSDYSWTDVTVDPGVDSPRFYRTEWANP